MTEQHEAGTAPATLCGMRVYADPALLVVKDAKVVHRTWRERLLSWPWKPWASQRLEAVLGPDPRLYRAGAVIIGHPDTIAAATQELARQAQACACQQPGTVH